MVYDLCRPLWKPEGDNGVFCPCPANALETRTLTELGATRALAPASSRRSGHSCWCRDTQLLGFIIFLFIYNLQFIFVSLRQGLIV